MYIQLDGQILYYEKTGDGAKSLILLHGNGENHSIFEELKDALLKDDTYTVYAIDTRGHGLSATPAEYHYADMATDLLNFIDALHIQKPVVFGFSDGGITALMAASKRPETFSGIIAAGTNSNPKGLTHAARSEIKRQFRADRSPLTEMMLKEPELMEAELSHITCPVILLAGQHDMVKEKDSKKIAAAIPHAKLTILPAEDHSSYVIHSAKAAEYIRKI